MDKTLQQVRDEYVKEINYSSWDNIPIDGSYNKRIDQIAIRYAQEVNKEMIDMLEAMEEAWQKLPYGHNSVKDTQNWITNDIHPQILRMREYVQKYKGDK